MNANELADKLFGSLTMEYDCDKYMEQAAKMLRQLQAELDRAVELYTDKAIENEALKLQLHTTLTNRELRTYDGKTEMNNKPVAWMGIRRHGETRVSVEKLDKDDIPLYTHPADLTDEEIDECLYTTDWSYDPHSFARAILRKAQEK